MNNLYLRKMPRVMTAMQSCTPPMNANGLGFEHIPDLSKILPPKRSQTRNKNLGGTTALSLRQSYRLSKKVTGKHDGFNMFS